MQEGIKIHSLASKNSDSKAMCVCWGIRSAQNQIAFVKEASPMTKIKYAPEHCAQIRSCLLRFFAKCLECQKTRRWCTTPKTRGRSRPAHVTAPIGEAGLGRYRRHAQVPLRLEKSVPSRFRRISIFKTLDDVFFPSGKGKDSGTKVQVMFACRSQAAESGAPLAGRKSRAVVAR